MTRILIALSVLALATACEDSREDTSGNATALDSGSGGEGDTLLAEETSGESEAAPPTDAWAGRWTGVEGLAIEITPSGPRSEGLYDLTIWTLDGEASYEGRAEQDAIAFTRDGTEQTVRAATGDETGLRYLAGKQNCLMIVEGEGFCRE